MLDTKDFQLLEKMFGKMLQENNEVFGRQLKREMRDEIHFVVNGAVSASEKRLTKLMYDVRDEILDGVSDIVGNEIVPQLDDHETRLIRLERKTA